jgi:hypothetical protein
VNIGALAVFILDGINNTRWKLIKVRSISVFREEDHRYRCPMPTAQLTWSIFPDPYGVIEIEFIHRD